MHVQRALVAAGIFLGAVSVSLPDATPGAPRAIVQAVALGLVGAGVYLGAPKPEAPP